MSNITINEKNGASKVVLTGVRGSYLKFVTPEAVKAEPNGKKRYGLTILVPKTNTEIQKILDQAVKSVKKHNSKVKWFPSNICIKDGDTDEKTKPEYAGHWFFSASRNEDQGAPDCYGRKKAAGLLKPEEIKKLFYPGCLLNVVIGIYKPNGWDKICASVETVQFAGDAERLGGGSTASPDDLPDDEPDGLDAEESGDDDGFGDLD